MKNVLLLGGGGHALVLFDILRLRGARTLGVADVNPGKIDAARFGVSVFSEEEALRLHGPAAVSLVNGLGSTGLPVARAALYERLKAKGYSFEMLVHPSAVVAAGVELGEGAQVMAGAVIQAGTRIGKNAIVNTGATVDHDCSIGDHTHLAPGVVLSGGVTVGAGCHVGTRAAMIQGVAVKAGTMVKAGALVMESLM